MKNIPLLAKFLVAIILVNSDLYGQGCVAIRGMSACSAHPTSADYFKQQNGKFQISANYRYFRSFRHFRGDVEQKERLEDHTEVINHSNTIDFGLTYQINSRLFFSAYIPLIHNDRSSLYEHYGNSIGSNPEQKRFHTNSQGIGDLRLSANYWLFHPELAPKFNMTIGGGIKLPSGNPGINGAFHKLDKEGKEYTITKPVDQSIQLGDGVVGFFIESQGYQQMGQKLALYFNGYYLSNPKSHNKVVRNPQAITVDPNTGYFSAADQFAGRLGASYNLKGGFSVTLGGRVEGVASSDLIGNDKGFRRPGYVISAEPGINYFKGKFSASASVPIALYRNRTKSYSDKLDQTGQTHGDAAFADYLISIGVSRWI